MSSPLDSFQTYDWEPFVELSVDENWMDLMLLLTRSSQLKQGSMCCILVRASESSEHPADLSLEYFVSAIVSIGTNQAIYSSRSSDVHAEIVAIGQAARRGPNASRSCATEGCTAYITMPPCKNCFAALCAAGIRRIVSRYDCQCDSMFRAASRFGIELFTLKETQEQRERVTLIVQKYKSRLSPEESIIGGDDSVDVEPLARHNCSSEYESP